MAVTIAIVAQEHRLTAQLCRKCRSFSRLTRVYLAQTEVEVLLWR
jgi:hypothetical protein